MTFHRKTTALNGLVTDYRRRILIILLKNDRLLQTRAPCYIEISTIHDFGRLVCAFERTPLLTFSFNRNEEHLLATQIDFLGNIPLIYFVKYPNDGQFLAYRHTGGAEEVIVVDSILNPAYIFTYHIYRKIPQSIFSNCKDSKEYRICPDKIKGSL